MTRRTHRTVRLVAALVAALAVLPPTASRIAAQTPRAKVLVIGIDGVRPDVLAQANTPNLDRLAAEGYFSARAETRFPTVSGPGWSSFLNGVWLDRHGVVNNEFTGEQYDRYPDFLTRIEEVRPDLRTWAVADWLPLVMSTTGRPTISDRIDQKVVLDGYGFGWAEADEISVETAVREIRDGDPDALFVYIGNVDETSHQTNSIGAPYIAALEEADRLVGLLVDAVDARPTRGDEAWLVLSSTDHGRTVRGGHGGNSVEERTIFFLASGDGVDPAWSGGTPEIVDIVPTALTHLGIPIDPDWRLAGKVVGLRGR